MLRVARKVGVNTKNIVAGVKNLALRSASELLKPQYLWFEITDECNGRCKFCNIWKKEPTSNILTAKEIEKVFGDNLFNGLRFIVISGGEPTFRDDFEEIILRIHNVLPKASILFGTNCSLPEHAVRVVKSALKHNIDIGVGVSLDGVGERHDRVRGGVLTVFLKRRIGYYVNYWH